MVAFIGFTLLSACRSDPPEPARTDSAKTEAAQATLVRIPESLALGPTLDFFEMREGDEIRGVVTSRGCWARDDPRGFVCTFKDAEHPMQRRWHFALDGRGQLAEGDAKVSLDLDALDVLDLQWELRYARLEGAGISSTSTLEYELEWWRDGELLITELLLDGGGAAFHYSDHLTLRGLYSFAEVPPDERVRYRKRDFFNRGYGR